MNFSLTMINEFLGNFVEPQAKLEVTNGQTYKEITGE